MLKAAANNRVLLHAAEKGFVVPPSGGISDRDDSQVPVLTNQQTCSSIIPPEGGTTEQGPS
jgi:hypothetical protein